MSVEMLSPHFSAMEFRCSCGRCTPVLPAKILLAGLEALRAVVGRPVIITSGHRCAAYNATVKNAVPNSRHITGRAADIVIRGVPPADIAVLIKYIAPELQALPRATYTHIQVRV